MAKDNNSVLSEAFIMDLIKTCSENTYVLSIVSQHLPLDYLPDRDSIAVFKALKKHYKQNKSAPQYSVIIEGVSGNKGAINLVNDTFNTSDGLPADQCISMLEQYIKRISFQRAYQKAGEMYNKEGYDEAVKVMNENLSWQRGFTLSDSDFVNVVNTFESRLFKNREKNNSKNKKTHPTRFYIDELDARNNGRELNGQLTCFLAPTGVGKSHIARWIGRSACLDGLNVLHFQLEGSKDEAVNSYSASLVFCSSYLYEKGMIKDEDLKKMSAALDSVSGELWVKSYPKFNMHKSTADIKEAIEHFKSVYNAEVHVVIIDSMDLLTDSSGRKYSENGERHRRIAVANDLKDIADEEDVWMVVTYQSTIENADWINDEKNVLSEYNTAEAKGLARPMTHLITLNQSKNERSERTMRINVAKSRFFERGDVFKIATNYDNEMFYDRQRTMNINKVR